MQHVEALATTDSDGAIISIEIDPMKPFRATLVKRPGTGTWTIVAVPPTRSKALGGRGQIKVTATIDGVSFRTTLMPDGAGAHFIVVAAPVRKEIGKGAGDVVSIILSANEGQRTVDVPELLARALRGSKRAESAFDALAYSHRKEYVDWINDAKKTETADRRVARAIELLLDGRRLKE